MPRLLLAALLALGLSACRRTEAPPPLTVSAPAALVEAEPPPDSKLSDKLWDVPAFRFMDQDGKPFSTADLHGHVWVADYIFTRCTAACPILTSKMKLVQRAAADDAVRFLSFSVDPANDTPLALRAYAAQWHLDRSHWKLVTAPNAAALQAFVKAMQTEVMAGNDPANPILHSETLVLIDAQGAVRGRYDSTSEAALAQLAADARTLDGLGPSAAAAPSVAEVAPTAEEGKRLAEALGCMACHARAEVAPRLDGVAGSTVKLSDATTVTADAAYLKRSILDPGKEVVKGYLDSMPSYRGHLSDSQVDALVAFVSSLSASAPASEVPVARVATVDPVCGMKLSAGPTSPQTSYEGKTYYFCSDTCRARFLADPNAAVHAERSRGMDPSTPLGMNGTAR